MKSILKKTLLFLSFALVTSQIFAQQKLIHYWHFNNFTLTSSVKVNPSTIIPLKADYSSLDTNKAFIAYRTIAGTSSNYLSYWDNTAGDTTNARLGFPAGNGLRPRDPWDSMQLMFFIPTNNYQNITLKFGAQRSSSGPATETYDYSLDSGSTWINTGLSINTFAVTATANPMNLVNISIANAAVNNKSNLIFRVRFSNASGGAGNNRLDNVTIEGDTLITAPAGPPFYNLAQITTTNPVTGNPDSLNVKAVIRGIVYGFNQRTSTQGGVSFMFRDNTGGATVFHASKTFGYTVAEGDSLQITGTVNTFRGLEEIAPDTIIKLASGRTLKTPTLTTSLTEVLENNLVRMNNLVFYTTPTGGIWPVASTNILCHTQGLNDTTTIRVLALSSLAGTPLPTSPTFSAIGMVVQFSTSSSAPFAFNGYQLLPRTTNDIISGIANPDSVIINNTSVGLNSITVNWTKPVTYNDANMSTLVFVKQGTPVAMGINNKNASYYTANTDFTANGTAYQNDALAKCVLNSDNQTVTVTGLNQNTNYYVVILTVRTSDSAYSGASMATVQTTNNLPNSVTGLAAAGLSQTSLGITWIKPSNYNNNTHKTMVFVKADNPINAGTPNKSSAAYNANSNFRSGSNLSFDTAAYCVFKGDTNFVVVNNLVAGKSYTISVWVDRDMDSLYAPATTGSGSTKPLPPPPPLGGKFVIHYWHFNNLSSSYYLPNIPAIKADTSMLDTNFATVNYVVKPGTSSAYSTYLDNVAGDTTNAKFGKIAGNGCRFRNPSDSMMVLFKMPTKGFKNLVFRYACQSSSTTSGMRVQLFDYSVDNGATWKTNGLTKTWDSTDVAYKLVAIPLTGDSMINNNPNFIFRITFQGNTSGASGNNRFDNVSLEGDTAGYVKPITGINNFIDNNAVELMVYPNPNQGVFTLNTNLSGRKNIEVISITGQVVYQSETTNTEATISLNNQNKGIYFVKISNENGNFKTVKLLVY